MRNKLLLVGGSSLLIVVALLLGAAPEVAPLPQEQSQVRFGFIRSVDFQNKTIAFDDAQWLTGKDAQDAAIAEGRCTEKTRNECTPNDYYILNPATSTVALPFSTDVEIAMMTLHAETEGIKETSITAEEFSKLVNDTKLLWRTLPYQVLVEDSRITIIEEVYVP